MPFAATTSHIQRAAGKLQGEDSHASTGHFRDPVHRVHHRRPRKQSIRLGKDTSDSCANRSPHPLSTLAAIVVIVVGCFAVTGIDRFTQRQQWKANITTNMASTVAAIDTLDLQNHGNIGFKDKDISCTDTRACFLNADAGIVTTGPARLRTENPAGRRRFHYPPAFHQRRACHEQLCRHRRKRPFPRFMHLLVANRRDQLQSAEVTL